MNWKATGGIVEKEEVFGNAHYIQILVRDPKDPFDFLNDDEPYDEKDGTPIE